MDLILCITNSLYMLSAVYGIVLLLIESHYPDYLFYTEIHSEKRRCKSASVQWKFILCNQMELRFHVPLGPNSKTLSTFQFRHLQFDNIW